MFAGRCIVLKYVRLQICGLLTGCVLNGTGPPRLDLALAEMCDMPAMSLKVWACRGCVLCDCGVFLSAGLYVLMRLPFLLVSAVLLLHTL